MTKSRWQRYILGTSKNPSAPGFLTMLLGLISYALLVKGDVSAGGLIFAGLPGLFLGIVQTVYTDKVVVSVRDMNPEYRWFELDPRKEYYIVKISDGKVIEWGETLLRGGGKIYYLRVPNFYSKELTQVWHQEVGNQAVTVSVPMFLTAYVVPEDGPFIINHWFDVESAAWEIERHQDRVFDVEVWLRKKYLEVVDASRAFLDLHLALDFAAPSNMFGDLTRMLEFVSFTVKSLDQPAIQRIAAGFAFSEPLEIEIKHTYD